MNSQLSISKIPMNIGDQSSVWSDAEREIWRPREGRNVWQWSDANRVLPSDSAEPGLYRSIAVPNMRAPQADFTDDEVEIIVLMAAVQVTKSTTMYNMLGYCIDEQPGPAGWVVPTENAVGVASGVVKAMTHDSPAVRRHWDGTPRALSLNKHVFDTMTVNFMWAGSPTTLAMRSQRYLFIDEPDKFVLFSGRDANPIDLAIWRTTTYADAKVVIACTPTTPDGQIATWYGGSNEQQYYCPCPHCGEFRVWKFVQLKCPKTLRDPDEIIASEDVWYECEVCGCKIREDVKAELVSAGKWLPNGRTMDADGNISGRAKRTKRISGYQVSALLSPFPKVTWPRILAHWFQSNTAEGIAAGALMNFHNNIEGIPHVEAGRRLKAKDLHRLTGGFSKGTVPDWCRLLVASADYHETQRGIVRIDWEVRGFGYGCRNAVVASGYATSWEEYDEAVLLSPFPWSDATANEENPFLAVCCSFEDAKYMSVKVYEHCLRHRGVCFPINGIGGGCRTPVRMSDLEQATRMRMTTKQKRRYRGMQLVLIDTDFFKDTVTSWAADTLDAEGNVTAPALTEFYAEIPPLYFREFTNEQKVRTINKRTGAARWTWQPISKGAQTHCLDTAVYAAAAGWFKKAFWLKDPALPASKPAAGRPRAPKKRRIGKVSRKN